MYGVFQIVWGNLETIFELYHDSILNKLLEILRLKEGTVNGNLLKTGSTFVSGNHTTIGRGEWKYDVKTPWPELKLNLQALAFIAKLPLEPEDFSSYSFRFPP